MNKEKYHKGQITKIRNEIAQKDKEILSQQQEKRRLMTQLSMARCAYEKTQLKYSVGEFVLLKSKAVVSKERKPCQTPSYIVARIENIRPKLKQYEVRPLTGCYIRDGKYGTLVDGDRVVCAVREITKIFRNGSIEVKGKKIPLHNDGRGEENAGTNK